MKRYKYTKLRNIGTYDGFIIHTPDDRSLKDLYPQFIVRELNRLNDRIKRLEEVGDKLYSAIYCGCLMDGPCKTCSDAADLWDEIKEAKP